MAEQHEQRARFHGVCTDERMLASVTTRRKIRAHATTRILRRYLARHLYRVMQNATPLMT